MIRDIFKDVQTVHNFRNQDLLSIELHPNYGTQQMFVTGGRGQQLLLRSIGFFRAIIRCYIVVKDLYIVSHGNVS